MIITFVVLMIHCKSMAKKSLNTSEKLKKVFNHYIIKNVLILIFTGVFIYWGTLVILRHYTHHGKAFPVPDIMGLTLDEAGKVLEGQKLRWQLSDSVYVSSVKPGAVVSQNPEPGFKVKVNRNIFLTMNALAPEKVKMPDVVGVSFRQAKTMLESQGLMVGRMDYVPDIAKDYVLKQSYRGQEIRRGTEIVKGSEIDLVLGQGLSDERTPVPDILGNTYLEARETLTKYSLNLSVPIYDQTVVAAADTVNAFIYRQRPSAGGDAMLQLGSYIDVWMTVDQTKKPDIPQEEDNE
jgi:beta-lactam-binding protein with PASTA domain